MPWLDFDMTVDGSGIASFVPQRGYLGTLAELAPGSPTLRPTYYHGDLIGSAQQATDGSGVAGSSPATLAYTAFGEHVTAGSGSAARIGFPVTTGAIGATRYHYAGAYGYESGLLSLSGPNATIAPITLQHVGARWYQPGIGRFVQRDPAGLLGGLCLYQYVFDAPTTGVDPSGEGLAGVIYHASMAIIDAIRGKPQGAIRHTLQAGGAAIPMALPVPWLIFCLYDGPPPRNNPYIRPWNPDDFHNAPDEGIRGMGHPPQASCPLNPGIPCHENPRCPNCPYHNP